MTLAYANPAVVSAPQAAASGYLPRSAWAPLWFAGPTLLCLTSWVAGGLPMLTDLGFVLLAAICVGGVVNELMRFQQRFGVGGLVFYGGVLLWICHDYFDTWFRYDFHLPDAIMPASVIAKAAFGHCLFLMLMAWGLLLPGGRWIRRLLHAIPEPSSPGFYFVIVLVSFAVGLIPWVFFTREPWYEAIWLSMISGRSGGPTWTVGRSGSVNYNWGGYLGQLVQIGQVGGQLAAFYAIMIARSRPTQVMALAVWAFWLAMAFGSGTRGGVVFMALPVLGLLYLRYQSDAAVQGRPMGLRAYATCAAVLLGMLVLVQVQEMYRNVSFRDVRLSEVDLAGLRGQTMFSEGLIGWQQIPSATRPFFYARFPGEAILRPIPDTIMSFLIGPIPRALWTSKPVDPVWAWYNAAYMGSDDGTRGTTIAQGLVGHWYFRYGMLGLLQGGLLMGWLLAVGERALQQAQGRPMRVLLSLAFLTWIFRSFRGMNFHDLYPLMIGGVVMAALVLLQRSLRGAR